MSKADNLPFWSPDDTDNRLLGTVFFPTFVLIVRFVLAVGSAVFDAMFNGGMATTSTEIELPDVEPAAFLALLKLVEKKV